MVDKRKSLNDKSGKTIVTSKGEKGDVHKGHKGSKAEESKQEKKVADNDSSNSGRKIKRRRSKTTEQD